MTKTVISMFTNFSYYPHKKIHHTPTKNVTRSKKNPIHIKKI